MYRITLASACTTPNAGPAAAVAISAEFRHRPWHQNVSCIWDGARVVLRAANDFDENGLALMDEFSDSISICVSGADLLDGTIEVVSCVEL